MADTYSGLKTKYGNFMVPSMEILIDDTDLISGHGLQIKGIEVLLSLNQPDRAAFEVMNCYDMISHSVVSGVVDHIKLGAVLEVKLGYSSDRSTVFKGYIQEIGLCFIKEQGYSYKVVAAGVMKLMQENKHRRMFSSDTYGEAFEVVMESYSGLCTCEAGTGEGELPLALYQDDTDYQFITKELAEEGQPDWEFKLVGGMASFKAEEKGDAVLDLQPGSGLADYEWCLQYVNKDITVLGYLPDEGLYTATATAASENLPENAVKMKDVEILKAACSQAQVNARAIACKHKLESSHKTGKLTTVGLPQLIPGVYVSLSEIDSSIDGTYYITEVTHVIDEDGYTSKVEVGG